MVPLPICLGTLRVAESKKDNRGKRSAQSGEEYGVAARAKSRCGEGDEKGENDDEVKEAEQENEEEADDEELRRKLMRKLKRKLNIKQKR